MDLGQIISVSATIQNPAINRYAFGEPAIYGRVDSSIIPLAQRSRRYSTATALSDMISDGFVASHPIYLAAVALCSQSPRPQTFKVLAGRADFTYSARLTPTAATSDDTVEVTIRGEDPSASGSVLEESVSVTGSGTVNGNATDLYNALVATGFDPGTVTFTDNTGSVQVDGASANDIAWFDDMHNVSVEDQTADRGITTDYADILAADSDWYELIPADAFGATELDLLATATQGASLKTMSYATQDSGPLTGSGIGDTLTLADRTKVTGIHTLHGLDEYPSAACSARFLALDPGTYHRAFKTLSGVTPSTYTTSQADALLGARLNIYTGIELGGVTVVSGDLQRGYCHASTEGYIDTYRLTDATVVEIQQRIFSAMRAADKIPMTDPGLSVIRGAIAEAIKSFGPLAYDISSVVVNLPRAADITAADRASRTLKNVSAGARFAGAINRVEISLTLSF